MTISQGSPSKRKLPLRWRIWKFFNHYGWYTVFSIVCLVLAVNKQDMTILNTALLLGILAHLNENKEPRP